MPQDPASALHINLQSQMNTAELHQLLSSQAAPEFGQRMYRLLNLDDVAKEAPALQFCVPEDWLSVRWDHLHDGYQYLALQQPLTLILSDQPPPQPLTRGTLRILFTSGILSQEIDDEAVLSAFAERANRFVAQGERKAIDITIEREVSRRKLREQIENAQSNKRPYHIWHHVGETRITPEGAELALADGKLKPSTLHSLLSPANNRESRGTRIFLLHTPSRAASLLPALSKVPAPCVLGLAMGAMSQTLLHGVYMRLLAKDLATAVFLAHLDCYIDNPQQPSWAALEMLCRIGPLRLVSENWLRSLTVFRPSSEIVRLLLLRANPVDSIHMLPIDGELKQIKNALAHRQGEYMMRDEGALEIHEFGKYLLETNPHLLHFSGHGTTRGSLVWETSAGTKTFVQPERIVPMLVDYKPTLQCVILNACYSVGLANLLKSNGIVSVGMASSVTDLTAAHFARALYQALAHGETLARAFDLARDEIKLAGALNEVDIPQISDYEAAKQMRFFKPEVWGT